MMNTLGSKVRGRLGVSLIVDVDPVFAYMAWHLVHSLVDKVDLSWRNIHVQFTHEVSVQTVDIFDGLGCGTHHLARFGDGTYCNKLAQWGNLREADLDHIVFLDTDMICIDDFSGFLPPDAIAAKTVDVENPKRSLLDDLFARAGFRNRPAMVDVDASDGQTYRGNCNGGFYSVPVQFADILFESWRRHAGMLLADIGPLRSAGKESHVDQISFCMALHETGLPFEALPSNANYYIHFEGPHRLRERERPLAMLHYHGSSLNILGLLEPAGAVEDEERDAVGRANDGIRRNFHSRLFWDMRYKSFPERGSGVGSRGVKLEYKRDLLRAEGAEAFGSVLDVGCGDLEVVGDLDLKNYVGTDRSGECLAIAACKRPDWTFIQAPAGSVEPAGLILCFEVAIHQATLADYRDLIDFLAANTLKTLIISGYDALAPHVAQNHMLFFYEPLFDSLSATGRFSSIVKIGSHSDVVIYRCDTA